MLVDISRQHMLHLLLEIMFATCLSLVTKMDEEINKVLKKYSKRRIYISIERTKKLNSIRLLAFS
jgi:hypothetical protein